MDRIQRLDQKFKELEAQREIERKLCSISPPFIQYSYDKPKLASSLYFLGFMLLVVAGLFLGWHWGWLVVIGIVGVTTAFMVGDSE